MEHFIEISTMWIVIFIFTGFFAGYIDAIAGGGGMIQVPVLLISGMSPIHVLATNKVASVLGVAMASIKYYLSKKMSLKVVSIAIIPCLIASYIGSSLVMYLSDEVIKWAILLAIPIAMVFLFKKSKDQKEDTKEINAKTVVLSTAPIGFYDGLLGPGTGTYMSISMKRFLKLDLLVATASTKPLNFATNVGSVVAFVMAGKVLWVAAISLGLANVLGSYVGSHYAIKNGEDFIKKVLVFVLVLMLLANIIKVILD